MPLSPCEHPFESNRLDGAADYRPDWDIPSAGRAVSTALNNDIAAVRCCCAPNPARKIHLLRGHAGYGKTHLFGRVQNEQREQVQFIFIPAPPDPSRPTSYALWQLVETLFHSTGESLPPLRRILARFLRPSFFAYFDQLPAGLRTRTTEIRRALEDNALAVLEVVGRVTDLASYHGIADSLRQRFPGLSGGTLRALILGLSPAAEDARAWLRGEADQIPEERLRLLRLSDRSPEPAEVIRAVATLLAQISVPLVLCLDQLDQLYTGDARGFQELASQLMIWLQSVPNLIVVLGCVSESWSKIDAEAGLAAFVDRVKGYVLEPLSPTEARELVCLRMRSWEEFDPTQGDGWPFDLSSVEMFAADRPVSPRAFIGRCAEAFDVWCTGGMKGVIRLKIPPIIDPPADSFLQEWNKQLAVTRQTLKAAGDYQDAELWSGIFEALQIAQMGQHLPAGIKLTRCVPQALRKSPTDNRPSAEVHLEAGGKRIPVVVAVSKKDSGAAFNGWLGALEESIGGNVAGAVVVWPRSQLAVGKTSQGFKRYQALVEKGTVRPFPLDANVDTFAQLECLRKLIQDANAGMLMMAGKAMTAEECRKKIVEDRLLANLKLFEFLFDRWPVIESALAAAAPATTSPPPPSPLAPRSPVPSSGSPSAPCGGADQGCARHRSTPCAKASQGPFLGQRNAREGRGEAPRPWPTCSCPWGRDRSDFRPPESRAKGRHRFREGQTSGGQSEDAAGGRVQTPDCRTDNLHQHRRSATQPGDSTVGAAPLDTTRSPYRQAGISRWSGRGRPAALARFGRAGNLSPAGRGYDRERKESAPQGPDRRSCRTSRPGPDPVRVDRSQAGDVHDSRQLTLPAATRGVRRGTSAAGDRGVLRGDGKALYATS